MNGELIIPARNGTLRVLRAAKNAGVKRLFIRLRDIHLKAMLHPQASGQAF